MHTVYLSPPAGLGNCLLDLQTVEILELCTISQPALAYVFLSLEEIVPNAIPDVVVQRLPRYLRALRALQDEGVEVVSSQELGWRLQVTPAQIRKDLSYFGRFGKQGRGYNVTFLLEDLTQILGLNHKWSAVVVGVGRLGRAVLGYPGFIPEGFELVAAFDADPKMVGTEISGVRVRLSSDMRECIKENNVQIAIVTVPATAAQSVVDELVSYGIRAILSYAPVALRVPPSVRVRILDPVLALETLTFYLHSAEREHTGAQWVV